jgi:hypothetical protein
LSKIILPFPSIESYREGEPIDKSFEFNISYKNGLNSHKMTSYKSMIEKLNQWNGSIYYFGLCIPSVCRAQEIENSLNKSKNTFFCSYRNVDIF